MFPRRLLSSFAFLKLMKHVSAISRHIDSMFASELITLIVLNWGRSIEDIARMECENQFGCVESMLGRWLFRIGVEFPSKYCTPRQKTTKRVIIMIIPVNFVILNCSWSVTVCDFPQPQRLKRRRTKPLSFLTMTINLLLPRALRLFSVQNKLIIHGIFSQRKR